MVLGKAKAAEEGAAEGGAAEGGAAEGGAAEGGAGATPLGPAPAPAAAAAYPDDDLFADSSEDEAALNGSTVARGSSGSIVAEPTLKAAATKRVSSESGGLTKKAARQDKHTAGVTAATARVGSKTERKRPVTDSSDEDSGDSSDEDEGRTRAPLVRFPAPTLS